MTEDFLNGLNIVSLNGNNFILSSNLSVAPWHPWRELYQEREAPPAHSTKTPSTKGAPAVYEHHDQLIGPPPRECPDMGDFPVPAYTSRRAHAKATRAARQAWAMYQADTTVSARSAMPPPSAMSTYAYQYNREVELHETIRLSDVEAFRSITAEKVRAVSANHVNGLSAGIARMSPSAPSTRPVIYRFIDAIKNGFALLEAIHFELFMPDRPDLRFLAVRCTSLPGGIIEGDYLRIHYPDLLAKPSFGVELGEVDYPVIWEVNRFEYVDFATQNDKEGLAYIVKKKSSDRGEAAISSVADGDLFIRENLFHDERSRNEHSLVRIRTKNMITAQMYAVEPPNPPPCAPALPKAADIIRTIESLTPKERAAVYKEYTCMEAPEEHDECLQILKGHAHSENPQLPEALDAVISKAGKKAAGPVFDPRSEYLKRVAGVCSSSTREGLVVAASRALDEAEADRIKDRLGAFRSYGDAGDLQLMHELFRLGSRYREFASQGMDASDAGEMKIDESIVLRTIIDEKIGSLEQCRPLMDRIYGREGAVERVTSNQEPLSAPFIDGTVLRLNTAQSRAVRAYADEHGPRVFCVRSPPGSGKTTVAAAMAAEVARATPALPGSNGYGVEHDDYSCVQLLLAVQNVAVDNMGAALKKMDYGGGVVYNMKSAKKLNPREPAPYDFFDLMGEGELTLWYTDKMKLPSQQLSNLRQKTKDMTRDQQKRKETEEVIMHYRKEYEKKVYPKIILSTVEMMLQKMYTDSKLNSDLAKVKNVIIDEASLLTEAALFCIIRRFPEARIVLIGDDKQLPPFMYDQNILGHELAGRPALSVAMKTGRAPVVHLNEVYRASPSLAGPYNRLAYGGKLVSKKPEGQTPLSEIGLIGTGKAQLLLIDVDGKEERNGRNMSLYNEKELDAVIRLLEKFPRAWTKDVMIICLYKEQKWRLQQWLHRHNSLKHCTVLTVDSAQGKEAPIVILMTTRTQRATDFFCSPERCNVAVSRQQKALIILGKASLLSSTESWSTVVNGGDFTRIKTEEIRHSVC